LKNLDFRAIFTDQSGKTYQAPMEPFHLQFQDLFLPISETLDSMDVSIS